MEGDFNGENSHQEHDARYSELQEVFLGSFLAQVEQINVNKNVIFDLNLSKMKYKAKINMCDVVKIEWILDSGCTVHIVNNDCYFSEFIDLKSPIEVKVGDDRIFQGTKIGKIDNYFSINNVKSGIIILNVIYVKNIDRNDKCR